MNPAKSPTRHAGDLFSAHAVLLSAACALAGWSLSLFDLLGGVGLAIAVPIWWVILGRVSGLPFPVAGGRLFRGWKWRIGKLLPCLYLLIALLAIVGGVLYPPNNLDAMNYRMPRVLHWLAEGQWEWIHANNQNLNTRSCGYEWLMAPLFAILGTDRLHFLPNAIGFLLLPGLIFAFLTQMGVKARVAWSWMWILPGGYCFALQAGSVGNDLPAVVFALAAFSFGLRWRSTGQPGWAFASLLACGLMTSVKPTTLPLLFPYAAVCFGISRLLVSSPWKTVFVSFLALAVSFLPNALINHHVCGDWTGALAENPMLGEVEPLIGLAGNSINLPLQNLAPPVFPMAGSWNSWFVEQFPEEFLQAMGQNFEPSGARFSLPQLQAEEWAGLGLGLSVLLGFSLVMGLFTKAPASRAEGPIVLRWWVFGSLLGIALLAYFSRAGMSTVARHVSPYYIPIVGMLLLAIPQSKVVRSRIWKVVAVFAFLSALVLVILTPARPLFPLGWVLSMEGDSRLMSRLRTGYAVYSQRSDSLSGLREALPEDVGVIGFMSYHAGPELPLWKPYLKRRVRHVRPDDPLSDLRERHGVTHVILNVRNFESATGLSPERWLKQAGGVLLQRCNVQIVAKDRPSEWWAVEL